MLAPVEVRAKTLTVGALDGGTTVFASLLKTKLARKRRVHFREIVEPGGYREAKIRGLAFRYDDASLDGLRSLSSRCKRCQVLRAVKRDNGHGTPGLLILYVGRMSRARKG